ncbi:Zinc finger MYM-type protein 1 [Araneus ventricosus]|uniref:Zinc finger MYM-type protein 1 n=1 Tax=Araneus ventricosus TaxID=182803 RepID=A0A4Y2VGD9_ARAVE|nr:Zinc finger MYM-type protein 1 [Araneus ventricosus]
MSKSRKRIKLECLECGSQFDDDYRCRHEKAKHDGKRVQVKHVGAFSNPFEASKRKVPVSSLFTDKPKEKMVNELPKDNLLQNNEPLVAFALKSAEKQQLPQELSQLPSSLPRAPSPPSKSQLPPSPPPLSQPHEAENGCSLLKLAGRVTEFLENYKRVDEILNQLKKDAVTNPKVFFTEIIDCLTKIHEESGELLEYAKEEEQNYPNSIVNLQVGSEILIEHDPGKRKKIVTTNERHYLSALGPFQPKLSVFPVNADIPTNKQRRFNSAWYAEFPLLEYSPFKDAAFCFACSLFHGGVGRSNANTEWASVGVRQWHNMKGRGVKKQGKLHAHFTSESHRAAMSDLCHFVHSGSHVDALLDKSIRENKIKEEQEKEYHMKILQILFDVAKTLGRQGLAFRGQEKAENNDGNFKQIVHLVSRHCAIMKKWLDESDQRSHHVTYLSNTSQNEFIDLLGARTQGVILEEIEKTDFFSIMADTTPDSSHQDLLAINIRYITAENEGPVPVERLLKMEVLHTKKTGEELAAKIFSSLNMLGIPTTKIVFQSYDFARNMSGEYNGTQQKLSEKCEKKIPYVPCQAHRINIFVETACNASSLIRGYFNVLESLYVFFTSSTKRFQNLHAELETIENSLQLKNLSKTRWTARAESVKAIWIAYEGIVHVLEKIKNNTKDFDSKSRAVASGLYKKIIDFDFICSLFFTKNVMFKIKNLTEALEREELNIIELINGTINSFQEMNNDIEINALVKSAICFAEKLHISPEDDYLKNHRLRHAPKKYDNNPETTCNVNLMTYYRKEFKAVLDVFASCVNDDLKNTLSVFEPYQKIFTIPAKRNNCLIKSIKSIVDSHPEIFSEELECLHTELQMLLDSSESCSSC